MAITNKKPKMKQTVGGLYLNFATAIETGTYEADVTRLNIVKSVEVTENSATESFYASGEIFESVNEKSNDEISVEVIAFDPDILAKMRNETVDAGGLILSGGSKTRPYFAFGKVVKKQDGEVRFEWFPKCQLVENSDSTKTSDGTPKEQNDTLTINAMPFNANGDTKTYIDSGAANFPEGLTEDKFFGQVILTPADLTAALA